MKKYWILLLPVLLAGCFRVELQHEDFYVEKMNSQKKAQWIVDNLKNMPGIADMKIVLDKKIIQVSYTNTVVRKMNIEQRISAMGFDVNHRLANPPKRPPMGVKR